MHRKLGLVGGLLLMPMVASGLSVVIAAARGEALVSRAVAQGGLYWLSGSPPFGDGHKRLMVLATIAMLPPALGRAVSAVVGASHPALFFGATMLFLVAIGIHDWRTSGRVHPVSLWRGLCLAVSFPGRLALGNTDTWLIFAGWLTR